MDAMTVADRYTFDNVILFENKDTVVFFYSTTNINYYQRKEAYQVNLAAKMLSQDKKLENKIKFYSYDVATHGIPFGIPELKDPPAEREVSRANEVKKHDLPAIFFFPYGQKVLPHMQYEDLPIAHVLIEFISERSG